MKIETKRLILRDVKKSDWKDIVDNLNDLEVSKNLASIPYPYKKKDAIKWIKKLIEKSRKKRKDSYSFYLVLKETGKMIGVTSLEVKDNDTMTGSTGSWLGRKYWRKGYMTEAKIPVLDFAFKNLKLKRLETRAITANLASNNMSKKLGYRFVGTLKKSAKINVTKKITDLNIYELLSEDWPKNRRRLIKEMKSKKL